MNEPLNQSSAGGNTLRQPARGALLDRIRAHQQLKRQSGQQQANGSGDVHLNVVPTASQQHQVPQYGPVSQQEDDRVRSATNVPSYSWMPYNANGSDGNGVTMSEYSSGGSGMNDALLTPSGDNPYYYDGTGEYSITKYFMTFVMDIYGLFNRLPVFIRWIVVILLLYIAFKLI